MSPITWTRTVRSVDGHNLDTVVVRFCRRADRYRQPGRRPNRMVVADAAVPRVHGARRPERSPSGYRRYVDAGIGLLRGLADLGQRLGVELADVAFVVRLRRDETLRTAVESWLTGATVPAEGASEADWIEWEQRKQERLLAA